MDTISFLEGRQRALEGIMDKSKTSNAAKRLREVTRQLEELIESGRTKRPPVEHKKKPHSRPVPAERS